MSALYSGASVFCYPSLDEGFGLPVLEAMRCGTPVVASSRPPLIEVAGDAALLADPHDVVGLAEEISSVLGKDELAQDLRIRGEQRAASFTWAASAESMVGVYEQAIEARQRSFVPGANQAGTRSEADRKAPSLDSRPGEAIRRERVFILGDGSDLDHAPLGILDGEFTFAINSFHRSHERRSWKPPSISSPRPAAI